MINNELMQQRRKELREKFAQEYAQYEKELAQRGLALEKDIDL